MSDRLTPTPQSAEFLRLVQRAIDLVKVAERDLTAAVGAAEQVMQQVVPPHPPPPPFREPLQQWTVLSRECAALTERLNGIVAALPRAVQR